MQTPSRGTIVAAGIVSATAAATLVVNGSSLEILRLLTHSAAAWPSIGLLLGMMLLYPRRTAEFTAGYYVGCVITDLVIGQNAIDTAVMPILSAAGLLLVREFVRNSAGPRPEFHKWASLLRFLVSAAFAVAISAVGAALFNAEFYHAVFFDVWLNWFITSTLSYAVFTPLVVVLVNAFNADRDWRFKWRRLAYPSLINFALALFIFGQSRVPVPFLAPYALIVTSLIGGLEATAIGLMLYATVAFCLTGMNTGIMIFIPGSPNLHLHLIQLFIASNTYVILPVAAAIAERTALRDSLALALKSAEEARDRAEKAVAAKSQFLANMSHELRTPLTAIIGYADLMDHVCELDEQPRAFVGRIRSAGEALLSTINDVLDFSKFEAGQVELSPEDTDLRGQAATVVDLLAVQANAKGLDIGLVCENELNERRFLVDPHRLRQVLLNLLGNALKFTERGRVSLRIMPLARPGSEDKEWLRYEIADTGVGIPAEKLAALFQRFSQVDSSSTRRYSGTGLGLAICKSIVEAMGGRIGVESAAGVGSTFWFELPLRPAPTRSTEADLPLQPSSGSPLLLVADDNAANRALVAAALSAKNIEVVTAENGKVAVQRASERRFDLVLMDVHMPEMDGTAAMQAIRKGGASSRTPILAFTAEGDGVRHEALRREGFDGILCKPLKISDLHAVIRDRFPDIESRAGSEARQVA